MTTDPLSLREWWGLRSWASRWSSSSSRIIRIIKFKPSCSQPNNYHDDHHPCCLITNLIIVIIISQWSVTDRFWRWNWQSRVWRKREISTLENWETLRFSHQIFYLLYQSNQLQLVVQEMGDDGDFSQGILDILYATEVLHDDFVDEQWWWHYFCQNRI